MRIPIVNEQDEIIGEEERSVIHRDGIRHREIHVWLVTPEKEFIFQKRGMHQEIWPGFLDITVGGHVDTKTETYQECAERELFEETGLKIPINFVTKTYTELFDPNTNLQNNAFRTIFAAVFHGKLEDLKIEEGSGLGFQKFTLDELRTLPEKKRKEIIPRFFGDDYQDIYKKVLETLFK